MSKLSVSLRRRLWGGGGGREVKRNPFYSQMEFCFTRKVGGGGGGGSE